MDGRRNRIIKWASMLGIALALLLMIRALPISGWTESLKTWVDSLGIWGPVVFGIIYVIATVLFLPGLLLTIAGGAIFGLTTGFITVSISSVVGACLAFLIARYVARERVEELAKTNKRFAAVDAAIEEGGWRVVGLLRLSPAIPFNLQNYLFGLTKVRFWPYMAISWIAMMPGTFLYVYLGHIAGVASGGGGSEGDAGSSIGKWVLLGVGLLATVAVSVYVTRLAQRKLRESESRDESTNDDQDPPNESRNNTEPAAPVSGGTALLWASVAAVMLSVAIIAQFQRDAIASYLGVTPQAVEIQSPEKE